MKKKLVFIISIVTLLLILVIIPIIINELYKIGKGYTTVWSGADMLSYYGSIVASVGGILGVFFSIKYAQKEYKEDSRQRIMPFIATEYLSAYEHIDNFFKKENGQSEANYYTITYTTTKGIEYPKTFPKEIENIIKNQGEYSEEITPGCIVIRHKKFYLSALKLKNVGEGAACKLTFGLYKLVDGEYEEDIDHRKTSIPFLLDKTGDLFVGIYWDLEDKASLGKYNFDIMYSDINYTRYRRSISFEIYEENDFQTYVKQNDTCEHKVYSYKQNGKIKYCSEKI
ncbi:MAG: hypothetical protein E7508_05635 [Ruminococcus sp.]|nr:hypothetical protein [Ruminococcus sp.]